MHQTQLKYYPKYPQSFTGKERDSETGFSYFGARYYDSDLMTSWLSVDPLADKYPNISPYAYCAWNPVKLVDPDGREIWILSDPYDPNASMIKWNKNGLFNEDGSKYTGNNTFIHQTASALDAIYSDENSRFLLDEFMDESDYNIIISEGSDTYYGEAIAIIKGNSFLQKNQPICFDPTLGLAQCKPDAENEEYLAPFISLLHEFGHAFNATTNNEIYHKRKETFDEQYQNEEERYVIEKYENPAVSRRKMLERTSHEEDFLGLRLIKTSGPLSSTPIK